MALALLVIQPTPFCNIDCDYCYLPDRSNPRRMSMETLTAATRQVFACGRVGSELSIVWHAGEPLVLPPEYFREAFAIIDHQRPYGILIRHSFQSNGVLLTDRWVRFIQEFDVNIGISIDGPAWLHDAHRKTRAGKGTHVMAMKGVERLRENRVPFHVICLLTKESIRYPDEIFDFFLEHEIRQVGFNIEEIEGAHVKSSLNEPGIEDLFRSFFKQILNRLQRCANSIRVREVDRVIACLRNPQFPPSNANCQNEPFGILSIAHDGSFSTFSPELLGHSHPKYGAFQFGNVRAGKLEDMLRDQRFQKLADDIETGVKNCRATCKYFSFCGGGAPANKLAELGTMDCTETLFCRLTQKIVVECVLGALETDLLTTGSTG